MIPPQPIASSSSSALPDLVPFIQPIVMPNRVELPYNPTNRKHKKIITYAIKPVKEHAVNAQSILTLSARKVIVQQKFQESATKHYIYPAFANDWSLANSSTLYMILSNPYKLIIHMLKKIVCTNIALFHLCPGAQLMVSEVEFKIYKIAELLSKWTFPPKFTFGMDESGISYFLENEVLWHVVLDAIMELSLYKYLTDLDSIFCAAAVALKCALQEFATGWFIDIEFAGDVYTELYHRLLEHLEAITADPSLLAQWNEYKDLTHTRLMQLCS
ncbi:uncharacterized protein EDB93DRAFT_1250616 [Suillus bovinus]|uniref:uncharacterized protein n=1 Tax=Suillus bovinus TaxID=48563 RepID=UPI001B85D06D|nr:uncharacterized protein EDB93DRAFT_1250616 [Suillus bovinus]KAG2147469.1 hypothetical protein EDB93DRAFT_1250616 [Suillus bovinus]